MSKPRLTKDVRDGWNSHIYPMITCILENGEESVFECKEKYRLVVESGDPNAESPDDIDHCKCEGCVATRKAWKAIEWINARI